MDVNHICVHYNNTNTKGITNSQIKNLGSIHEDLVENNP